MLTKIDNAIILAAGRGSRLSPLTDNKPKCLIKIKNKPVIERLIETLISLSITDISIVVGYLADKLLYLKHKYSSANISFIYNPKWSTTNSITSMYYASSKLSNTVVIDSDIYILNSSCIRTAVEKSGYSGRYKLFKDEWQLDTSGCSLSISKIMKNTSSEYSYGILDISYRIKKDSDKLKLLLDREIKQNNTQKYRDDIPCIDYFNKFKLQVYPLSKDDALEFDTIEELKKLRRLV